MADNLEADLDLEPFEATHLRARMCDKCGLLHLEMTDEDDDVISVIRLDLEAVAKFGHHLVNLACSTQTKSPTANRKKLH